MAMRMRATNWQIIETTIGGDLRAVIAACGAVTRPCGTVTAVTIILGARDQHVGRLPLASLEHTYGVRVRVLDEGSLTSPPCLRIERVVSALATDHPTTPALKGRLTRLGHWLKRASPWWRSVGPA